jgi:hypothetical protein
VGSGWDNSGTMSLKSLALKVLQRDKARDTGGTRPAIFCPTSDAPVGQNPSPVPLDAGPKAELLAVLLPPVTDSLSPLLDPDALDERAAIIEYGAGVPRRWAEGYAALASMPAPTGFSSERWARIVDATGAILDHWAAKAIAYGWSDLDVFGCDPDRPDARFDCMGLVLLLDRCEIIGIDVDGANLVIETGARQRYRRRPLPANTVSLWEMAQLWTAAHKNPSGEGLRS